VRHALRLAAFCVAALCVSPPPCLAQDAVADFYRGRQVSVLVGSSPGGSASLYAQALARHMSRYLPGAPAFVVQHVPGAGGLVVANTVANTSPRDGTVFAITSRTTALEPLLGNRNAKFDGPQLAWLGTANVEYTTCFAWNTAAVKTLQDAMRRELIVAGSGADATEVVWPKVANKLIGTRFKIVLGYPGSTEMLLALERGEVEGNCGLGWTFLKQGRLAAREENQHPVPVVAAQASRSPRRSADHRFRPDRGGPPGLRVPAGDAGDGPSVLRAARRAGGADQGAARGLRADSA